MNSSISAESVFRACSRNVFWGGFQTHVALLKHYKNHTKLAVPESKELASEGVFGVAAIFLSCDCSR